MSYCISLMSQLSSQPDDHMSPDPPITYHVSFLSGCYLCSCQCYTGHLLTLLSWWHVSKFPTCPPILFPVWHLGMHLSAALLQLLCFPRCSKYQSVKIKTYQGLGCSILSLATGIPSLALAAACPAHNLKALGLCCLWTSRLLHIRALLGPTHIPSRGCLWSRTQPRLCCLWTRACFSRGCLWSRTQPGLCC